MTYTKDIDRYNFDCVMICLDDLPKEMTSHSGKG